MKIIPFLFILLFFLGCANNNNTDAVLNKAPFASLTDSINREPKNAALQYKRGVLLFENGEMEYAEKDLRNAWDLQPTEEHALSLVTLLIKKDESAAITFIEQALKKLPQSIALKISLARGYQQKGNLQKSLAICNDVLQKFPGQIDALLLKADLLKESGKNEEAITLLEKAYTYAPFDAELSHNLAFEYAEAKNPKVLSLADSLIKADSLEGHAEPYYFKGIYFSNKGNTAEAIKQFDEAIRHNYNFMNAYINKGIVYYDQKKYNEAQKVFSLAASINPAFADSYYWLGKCEEALNKKEEAKLNYLRAYGLDKTMTEAKEAAEKIR
jgi:tetratricopeptide (TPR) repeat protein